MTPDPGPLASALADTLQNERATEGERPTADDTRLRGSDAYKCSRQIVFRATGTPRAIPLDTATLQAFDAGKHHHARLQGVLASKFGAELEVPVSFKPAIDLSGHADAAYPHERWTRVVAEIKSMKAWGWRRALKDGPKIADLVQAGIYAVGLEAGAVHIVYINKEDGAVSEWLIGLDEDVADPETGEMFGHLRDVVEAELARLGAVQADLEAGRLPIRFIPGHGVVKRPPAPDSKDDPWNCRYCGWQPICATQPASRVPSRNLTGPRSMERF